MTPNELRTAADDLDRLEELEPRPGRVWLADRLRRGAEWLEVPPDGMVEAAAKAIHDYDRETRPTEDERWDQLGEIQEFYHLLARAALVAAARWAGGEQP